VLVCVAVGLACVLVGPFYFEPWYDKLWLQPLALFFFTVGFLTCVPERGKGPRVSLAVVWSAVAAFAVLNVAGAVADHRRETEGLPEAQQVARVIHADDLLISDWGGIWALYASLYRPDGTLCVPAIAERSGKAALLKAMDQAIRETSNRSGRVFFLGMLDLSEEEWNGFMGQRLHVPYDTFDAYREHSEVVARFDWRGSPITLRRWTGPACRAASNDADPQGSASP
jgi:hypothetical protein